MNDLKRLSGWLLKGSVVLFIGFLIGSGLSGCGGDKNEPPDYKSILKDASRYVAEIEQKNEKLVTKLEDTAKKVKEETKGDADENGNETLDELMAENQALMEEKEALAAEIAELTSGEEQAVTKKIASLEAKNRSLSGKKTVYEEEIAKLRKTVKKNEGFAETVETLELTNEKLTEQRASLEKEIADLRAELGKAEKMAEKLETLEAENKKLADLNKVIKSRMEEIQKIMSDDQKSKTDQKHKK